MTTIWRKLLVAGAVAMVLGVAGIYEIVNWLARHGIIEMAAGVRDRYLDGTSIAVIAALLVLLGSERPRRRRHDYPPCHGRRDW